ncbi:hypothetical protein SteCoe_25894 [Stentor coeruleus]|uniref:Uncharacterized protein n=1 Tax=Stentor coeruleus TaxID=5963 RepID=A0A1R2BE53_9CILI|nr:hypothetical protein SteCoe_25894 [Stentor coeruleus]
MAFRRTPQKKTKEPSPSTKQAHITLKTSLHKVIFIKYQQRLKNHLENSILNIRTSTNKTSPRHARSPSLRKKPSPSINPVSKTPFSRIAKYSDISLETFVNDASQSSSVDYQETKETVKPFKIKKTSSQNREFNSEIDCFHKEIDWLKTRLMKLQNSSYIALGGKNNSASIEKDVSIRLKKQKEKLMRKHKEEMERQKEELIKSFNVDFESFNGKIAQKLKDEQIKIEENKEKELEERVKEEVLLIEKESEAKLKLKLNQVKSDYERQLKRAQDENNALKKQTEVLKRLLEDSKAKCEVIKTTIRYENNLLGQHAYEGDKEYKELQTKYNNLQRDYTESIKNNQNLCQKCKAFIKFDEEVSQKISTLRKYIDFSD